MLPILLVYRTAESGGKVMIDLEGTDEELAEALWLVQHQKSELYEMESKLTRELFRRAEGKQKVKKGPFEVNLQLRAYVKRDLPDVFHGKEK